MCDVMQVVAGPAMVDLRVTSVSQGITPWVETLKTPHRTAGRVEHT